MYLTIEPKLKLKQPQPFVLSIEIGHPKWPIFVHPFHLGTDIDVARAFACEIFERCRQGDYQHHGSWTPQQCTTVAIMRNGKVVDTWDGRDWSSALHAQLHKDRRMDDRAAFIVIARCWDMPAEQAGELWDANHPLAEAPTIADPARAGLYQKYKGFPEMQAAFSLGGGIGKTELPTYAKLEGGDRWVVGIPLTSPEAYAEYLDTLLPEDRERVIAMNRGPKRPMVGSPDPNEKIIASFTTTPANDEGRWSYSVPDPVEDKIDHSCWVMFDGREVIEVIDGDLETRMLRAKVLARVLNSGAAVLV